MSTQKGSAEWYESLIARYKPEDGASTQQFSSPFYLLKCDVCFSFDFLFLLLVPQTLEDQLKKLVQIVDCVCADVHRAQNIYNKLFYR